MEEFEKNWKNQLNDVEELNKIQVDFHTKNRIWKNIDNPKKIEYYLPNWIKYSAAIFLGAVLSSLLFPLIQIDKNTPVRQVDKARQIVYDTIIQNVHDTIILNQTAVNLRVKSTTPIVIKNNTDKIKTLNEPMDHTTAPKVEVVQIDIPIIENEKETKNQKNEQLQNATDINTAVHIDDILNKNRIKRKVNIYDRLLDNEVSNETYSPLALLKIK